MRCKAFAFILAVLAIGSLAGAAAPPMHVKATLLADVKQIVPGKPFHLGVLVEIDPGWHIYWLNPGDSGMATKITLDLPKGLTAGDVQFPTPIKIVDPGNINVYGYTDKVMFIATVTSDASITPHDVDFSATVSYLVCKDICIPGKATPRLSMSVEMLGGELVSANQRLFSDWWAQLPVALEDHPSVGMHFKQELEPAKQSVEITFFMSSADSFTDVFPGPNDDVDVKVKVDQPGGHPGHMVDVNLQIVPLAGHKLPGVTLPVVLGFNNRHHRRRGVFVKIDLSKLKPADSKPPHG